MSVDINKTVEKLAAAALACEGWSWPDRMRDENGTHHFGQRRDGEFYGVGTIDAWTYTSEYADDIRVLKFLRAAQPEAILAVTAEIDGLRADLAAEKRKNLELSRVYAERGNQIERLDAALAATAAPAVAQAEPERLTTDQSREYLVEFMMRHFTDKTYHRYIRGERGSVNLAGDFAWQMARALRMIQSGPPAAQQVGAALDRPAGAGQTDCYCGGWDDATGRYHQGGCPEADAPQPSAQPALAAPPGWKLVPLEPTPKMVASSVPGMWLRSTPTDHELARQAAPLAITLAGLLPTAPVEIMLPAMMGAVLTYRAVLAAAPSPPAPQQNGGA